MPNEKYSNKFGETLFITIILCENLKPKLNVIITSNWRKKVGPEM